MQTRSRRLNQTVPVEIPRSGKITKPTWNDSQKALIRELNLESISTLTSKGSYKDSHILFHKDDKYTRDQLTQRLNTKFVRDKILTDDDVQPLVPCEEMRWHPLDLKSTIRFKDIPEDDGSKCCECKDLCNACYCFGVEREW